MSEVKIKFLRADGTSPFQDFAWALPTDEGPGAWLPAITGELVACQNGYHATGAGNLLRWMHESAYEVESQSEWIDCGDKLVTAGPVRLTRKLAWDDRTARHFACDCAERVLTIFERARPNDMRVRECIATARAFADGNATQAQLAAVGAAAGDAAWDAAGDAAWCAAGDAAWDAAGDAAWCAARAAAWDAADAAAAASYAARDAALAAAWDAADAARAAAGDAAWDAADAARAAARDAAWDSARKWQSERLRQYLYGEVTA